MPAVGCFAGAEVEVRRFLGFYILTATLGFIAFAVATHLWAECSPLVKTLIYVAASGGLGATTYAIRGYYQAHINDEFDLKYTWWYIFRPLLGVVVGVVSYFLLVGGLLSLSRDSEIDYGRSRMLYVGIAYLAGFSFTQFTNKLVDVAKTFFTKRAD